MPTHLEQLESTALSAIASAKTLKQLEEIELLFLGRKQGELTNFMKTLKDMTPEERKQVGEAANAVKEKIEKVIAQKKSELQQAEWTQKLAEEQIDITQPSLPPKSYGHLHPITLVQRDLEDFFTSMGFMIADGPELESEYYNFDAVNVPANHPARDMQDTFYIKHHPNWVMRTHTSSVQVRALQKYGAPIRAIVPGRCFRNEATDARHEHTFNQLEGVVVDTHITFAHLKGTLEAVAKHLYGEETKVRLRPKFYPFVEPGVNGEVTCFLCKGSGCRVCKNTGWLEVLGAGMIHPHVLKEGGIDPEKYQGFAFGFGLTRLVMLKYGIEDVRLMLGGDIRFLNQF
jgi:phenylalanyl-tRNA synthetase alpha chain